MDIFDIAQISLQDMLLVRAISEFGSVSQAATTVRISQPTASYRLNKLREVFDDPIFVNINRTMHPTPLGLRLIVSFRTQIDQLLALIEPETFEPLSTKREFAVISPGVLIPGLLADVPKLFFNATRQAKIFFQPAKSNLTINQQLHERADFYSWTFDPKGAAGIRRLVSPELKTMMHYDSSMRDAPKTIEEFTNCRFVKLGVLQGKLGTIDTALIKLGYKRRQSSCYAPTAESVKKYIKGTDLIYCGTSVSAQRDADDLTVADVPFEVPGMRHELRWSLSKEKDPAHSWLLNLITKASNCSAVASTRADPNEDFMILTEFETL